MDARKTIFFSFLDTMHNVQELIFQEQVSDKLLFWVAKEWCQSSRNQSCIWISAGGTLSVQVSPDRSQIMDLIEKPMLKVELGSVVGLIWDILGEHFIKGILKNNHCIIYHVSKLIL